MSAQFEYLFTPLEIGPITVKNRICYSAHSNFFATDNLPSERQAYYFAERAKGGVGWIVVGGSAAHPSSAEDYGFNLVSDERSVPGYRRLTEMVHEHGTAISTQIDLYGKAVPYPRPDPGPLLSASSLPNLVFGESTKAVEREDMEMLIDATVRGVEVAKEGGFDGVELLASLDWSLLEDFLSPRYNKRSDEYGGSLENRLRFPLEMLARVRGALGREHCLGLKLIADELAEGGLGQDELTEIAKRFADSGLIDYLHVCLGTDVSYELIIPEMSYPAGFASPYAAAVREVVDIPVVAIKRINDPIVAERILADGHADVVGMTRALIVDPELPKKAEEGRLDSIRQCTGSNQECVFRVQPHTKVPLRCVHNPAVGYEKTLGAGTLVGAERTKKVVVVGGGPGGMRAAKVAAQRGHDVHLFEKCDELGGQVRSILNVDSRNDYESVIRYLIGEIDRRGVNVHLGEEVSAAEVLDLRPDAVIAACGARVWKSGWSAAIPHVHRMPGVDESHVIDSLEVFDQAALGHRIVVIDELGDNEGSMVAEWLADQGKEVTMVSRLEYVGRRMEGMAHISQMQRLVERGVALVPMTLVTSVAGRAVRGQHVLTGVEYSQETDNVVLVMGKQPNDALYVELKGKVREIYRVGDCVAPRRITDAIYEGNLVGRKL